MLKTLLTSVLAGERQKRKEFILSDIPTLLSLRLHRNFYTNTLDAASVQTGILHAVKFVEELEKMKPTSIGARLQPFLQREMARGRLEIVTGEKVHHGGIPYNVTHRINF